MPVPTGYSLISTTWNVTGTSRNVMNTHGVYNGGLTTAAAILAAFRAAMVTTISRPYSTLSLNQAYTMVSQKALTNIGGALTSAEDFTPVNHTGSGEAPPINTAMLITKVTGLAGRRYRGRVFSPHPVIEGNVSAAGVYSAGTTNAYQSMWDNAVIALTSAGIPLYLFHSDGSTPNLITSMRIEQRLGTIGRRLRG